jgi:hypothetical protein
VKPYRHKLNREDVATGTILIEKHRWTAFPPPMQEFTVAVAGRRIATRIVAEDCACVPPAHQHMHLEASHFRDLLDFDLGAVLEIDTDGDRAICNGS